MDPYDDNSFEESHVSSEMGAGSPAGEAHMFVPPRAARSLPPAYAALFGSLPAAEPAGEAAAAVEAESIVKFKDIIAARLKKREKEHPSFSAVPQFFFRKVPNRRLRIRRLWLFVCVCVLCVSNVVLQVGLV